MVSVTMIEAAGCAREERYFGLAEVAYEWLVRNGYINFGCMEHASPEVLIEPSTIDEPKKPRMTLVVVGAGIAGLSCARQLDSLLRRYAHKFVEYEDIPRIIVLEARRRIGGRIYSAPLKSDHNCTVDLGAQMILGFGNGNPLAVVVRRQLGLPVVPVDRSTAEIYDGPTGELINQETNAKMSEVFDHVFTKMSHFRNEMPRPSTANGDEVLMKAAKDPVIGKDDYQEQNTIGKLEENGELPRPYEDPGEIDNNSKYDGTNDPETSEELEFLSQLGISVKVGTPTEENSIHVVPEPQGEMYPGLGQTMDGMVSQLCEMANLTPQDMRLLNWHYADFENIVGSSLDYLSLGSWKQDDVTQFNGKHSMVQNGYQSLTRGLYIYPEKLDVRFKTSVKVIEYSGETADVFLENNERIHADRVVLTVPLGALKDRTIQFIPDLPQWKTDSIERLGFGVVNKVVLVYDEPYWDQSKDVICVAQGTNKGDGTRQEDYKDTRGRCYLFWNCTKAVGKPCLVGMISGDAAFEIANESDEIIVEESTEVLSRIYPAAKTAPLVESIVTRWQIDPYTRGSYSYVGLEATGSDYDLMARPIGNSVFFAGEATCRQRPGTVHGAYISGLRAAKEILTSLIGEIPIPYPLIPSREQASVNRAHVHSAPPPTQAPNSMGSVRMQPMMGNPSAQYPTARPVRSSVTSPVPPPMPTWPPPVGSANGGGHQTFEEHMQSQLGHHPAFVPPPPGVASGMKRKPEMSDAEERLRELKDERVAHDNERMRNDLIKELGERPIKPERSGANPFLIFQKDFWEKCRQETDKAKQQSTGDPNARASRNEVRAALGKMWREFPEKDKKPYLTATKSIKETNNRNLVEFREKVRRYDADAEDFRRRWKEEHASKPSEEELRLQRLVQEVKDRAKRNKRHHNAMT